MELAGLGKKHVVSMLDEEQESGIQVRECILGRMKVHTVTLDGVADQVERAGLLIDTWF